MEKPRFDWLPAVKIGLVGGAIGVLLALVGMVEAFSIRDIVDGIVSMGQMLMLISMVFTGYLAARRTTQPQYLWILGSSLLAGLLFGGMMALLLIVGSLVNLRAVFINASPTLYELLAFGRGTQTGALLLLAEGALVGVAAGLLYLLPGRYRQALVNALGLVVMVGVLQELLRITFAAWGPLAVINLWLFTGKGLSVLGATSLFVLGAGATYFSSQTGSVLSNRLKRLPPAGQHTLRLIGILLPLLIVLTLPQILGLYLSEVLTIVGVFVLMGLGLNIVVGLAGLLDLGYVAFFAIGAYTMGALTSPELGFFKLSFWEALPLAVIAGVLAGVILGIPVLKMRGDYLAIVTLGFGEIVRILALSDFLRPWIGGAQGIAKIPKAIIGNIEFISPQQIYYLILVGCVLAGFISWRLKDSRLGRAWMAVREDEDVAAAMGINLVATKLLAFAAGAAFSALSGAIFASKLGSVYPHSFNVMISINVLCLIIVGGMGSVSGVIVGAAALVGLPELLREFAEYRFLAYGAALVLMMLARPEGLMPEATRRRELHEAEAVEVEAEPALVTPASP
jgi:branched-chain amino acid transport system permease protein